jgi:hypothetical protein
MRRLLSSMMMVCSVSTSAFAEENWICTYSGSGPAGSPVVRYVLRDGTLTQTSDLPWVYHVLINNDLAIVATAGEGIENLHASNFHGPVILSETVAINRKTGEAVSGAVTLYGSNTPSHGTCKTQPSVSNPAAGTP